MDSAIFAPEAASELALEASSASVAAAADASAAAEGIAGNATSTLTAVVRDAVSGLSGTELGTALAVLFAGQAGLIVMRTGLLTAAGEGMAASLRNRLFQRLTEQEMAFFDSNRTGDLINRLSADTLTVQKAVTSNVAQALRNATMAVGGSTMLFMLSPPLAALSLALIPPVGIGAVFFGRYVKRQQKEVQDRLGTTMQVAEELVSSMRTVRLFAAESREAGKFAATVTAARDQAVRVGWAQAGFDASVHYAANLALIAVLVYGGSLIQAGAITPGELTAFLLYSVYTGVNITGLSSVYGELMRGVGALSRVQEIVNRAPALPIAGGVVPEQVGGAITFDSVSFSYPQRADIPVLHDVTLSIGRGESLALVGGSGSGKSTLAMLLSRLYDPKRGTVAIDGHDLRNLDPQWLRGHAIGVVPQEPTLFAATIAQNIAYGVPEASAEQIEQAARRANAHAFIAGFPEGYETMCGERGVQLSGGQKQRIAIARAILKEPPVLICDEATSALDADSEAQVQDALSNAARGRTVISIAHRLSTIRAADRVAVLDDGRIVETGQFDTLMAQGERSALWRLLQRQLRSHSDASDDETELPPAHEGEVDRHSVIRDV